MAQIVADDLGDVGGGGDIADTPAGHGIGLGHAVDEQGAGLDLLPQGGQAGELLVVIGQAVVDLVGQDIQVVVHAHLGDALQLAAAVHHAGGVAGVVQDHALGFGGDGGGELLGGDLKVLGLGGVDDHGHAAYHADQLDIADPIGGGEDHLVPRVDQGAQGHIDACLRAVGHGDVLEVIVQPAVGLQPLADGLAQLHGAHAGGIAGIVVADGLDTGLLDVVGGGEIGLARAEADDVLALGLHLLEHGVDGHGAGGLDGKCELRQRFHKRFLPSGGPASPGLRSYLTSERRPAPASGPLLSGPFSGKTRTDQIPLRDCLHGILYPRTCKSAIDFFILMAKMNFAVKGVSEFVILYDGLPSSPLPQGFGAFGRLKNRA